MDVLDNSYDTSIKMRGQTFNIDIKDQTPVWTPKKAFVWTFWGKTSRKEERRLKKTSRSRSSDRVDTYQANFQEPLSVGVLASRRIWGKSYNCAGNFSEPYTRSRFPGLERQKFFKSSIYPGGWFFSYEYEVICFLHKREYSTRRFKLKRNHVLHFISGTFWPSNSLRSDARKR